MSEKENENGCQYSFAVELCSVPAMKNIENTAKLYPECPTEPPCGDSPVCVPEPVVKCKDPVVTVPACDKGCKWYPEVCIPSVPPSIPCAPVCVGYGAWDGGVPSWTQSCLTGCDAVVAQVCTPNSITYKQTNWEHVLDLATHPEFHSFLTVMRNGITNKINTMEFIGLAVKLFRLAMQAEAVPGLIEDRNAMGIGYVDLGPDDNGNTQYGLTTTYQGEAIGSPLPLVTIYDANGDVVSANLPNPA